MDMARKNNRVTARKRDVKTLAALFAHIPSGEAPGIRRGGRAENERTVRDQKHMTGVVGPFDDFGYLIDAFFGFEIAEHPKVPVMTEGKYGIPSLLRLDARNLFDLLLIVGVHIFEIRFPRALAAEIVVADNRQERIRLLVVGDKFLYAVIEHLLMNGRVAAVTLNQIAELKNEIRPSLLRDFRARRHKRRAKLSPHDSVAVKLFLHGFRPAVVVVVVGMIDALGLGVVMSIAQNRNDVGRLGAIRLRRAQRRKARNSGTRRGARDKLSSREKRIIVAHCLISFRIHHEKLFEKRFSSGGAK